MNNSIPSHRSASVGGGPICKHEWKELREQLRHYSYQPLPYCIDFNLCGGVIREIPVIEIPFDFNNQIAPAKLERKPENDRAPKNSDVKTQQIAELQAALRNERGKPFWQKLLGGKG